MEAPKKIMSVTNLFSTEDIELDNNESLKMHEPTPIDQSFLKLKIPKLVPGDGSMIKLEMLMMDAQQNHTYYNYTVSAVYDQGSIIGKVLKPAPPATAGQILVNFINYIVENSVLVGMEVALIPLVYFILRWLTNKFFKRRWISQIVNGLITLRVTFLDESNPSTYQPYDEYFTLNKFLNKFKDQLDIDDRILLTDLNIKLFWHSLAGEYARLKASNQLEGLKLKQLLRRNRKTLGLIERALRTVDWAKYKKG